MFYVDSVFYYCSKNPSTVFAMDTSGAGELKDLKPEFDSTTEEEYASQSKLLQEFVGISSIDKAWIFKSDSGMESYNGNFFVFLTFNFSLVSKPEFFKTIPAGSQAMFSISQPNLLANKRRKFMLSSNISKESSGSVNFQWAPFPVEMTGISAIIPSPSGSKLLVVRNPENESPTQFEIWGPSQLEKEFLIPHSVHGSVYVDGWYLIIF